MIEFAETKSSVILFVYDEVPNLSKVSLINSSTLYITDKIRIKLYKNIRQIQNVSKHHKYVEIVLVKDQPCKWYTVNGPSEEEKKEEIKNMKKEKKKKPVVHYEGEEEEILNLLSKIYQNGDENTKRAMEKSFIESQGTVLSTNWEDVKQGKVHEYDETAEKELKDAQSVNKSKEDLNK
jgi:suppressor of G2 allele of SKP1